MLLVRSDGGGMAKSRTSGKSPASIESAKYFDISDEGHVVARPLQEKGCAVDLTDVAEEARARGLKFPLLVRFQDILRHRVDALNQAFRNSIAEYNYQGSYRGVFPIK